MNKKIMNILFLSNMMAEKGVWTAIEATKILSEKGLNFNFHFVGKWSDITEKAFYDAVEDYHLEKVCYAHGGKFGEDKETFWDDADFFVFPTFYHNECFPLVLLEAMQHHLPCISTTEGGIPTIIDDGKTGFLVKKHDYLALAEKMEYYLLHPEECKKMGENGYQKFLQEFTLHKFEERMAEILSLCLQKDKDS